MNARKSTEPEAPANEAESKCHQLKERSVDLLRRNPVEAVFGAFAIGLAIGLLLPRHHPPTWRERYVDVPTGKLKEWFDTAVERTSDVLGDCREHSTEMAKNTVSAVRKGLGKLRFW